jgi:hypothetical protein
MAIRLPDTVLKVWGESAGHDFEAWLEDILADDTVGKEEWRGVGLRMGALESRMVGVESRLDKVESRLDQVDTRLGIVERDLVDLKTEMREFRRAVDERFDRLYAEMGARFDEMHRQMAVQTRWTIGVLALFGTLITLLVGIGQLTH